MSKRVCDPLLEAALERAEQESLHPGSTRATPAARPAPTTRPTMAQRAVETGAFRDPGDFFAAVRLAATASGGRYDPRLLPLAANPTGLGQQIPSEGGFLVPGQFLSGIWAALDEAPDSLLRYCDVYPNVLGSLTLNAPAETSRATGSRYGGVRAYWTSEADEITASKPKVRQIKLEPQGLAVMIYATEKLVANGAALSEFLERAAGAALVQAVNAGIISGSGTGQPLGILNAPATVSVAKEAAQAAETIVAANVAKMCARLHPSSWSRAVWLAHPSALAQLLALGAPFDAATMTLAGRPVVLTDSCAVLGTVGDVILADMGSYAVGHAGGGPAAAASIHVRFIYQETAFRFLFPIDGQPWLASAVSPATGSDTLSPFVTLATRS